MSSTTPDRTAVVLGRCLLVTPFILGAAQALADPGASAAARRLGLPGPVLLTKIGAAAMLGSAAAVGTSLAPAVGGVVLAASLAGTTAVVHGFWRETEAPARDAHRQAFLTNCGLLGGVVIMTAQATQAVQAARGGRAKRTAHTRSTARGRRLDRPPELGPARLRSTRSGSWSQAA